MPIRIATAPVSWGILEVEGWAWNRTWEQVLDEMAAAGYAGTELGPYGFLPTDPQALRKALASRHLQLLGAFVPLPLADPSRKDQAIAEAMPVAELLAAAGAPLLVLADRMDARRMAVAGRAAAADGLSDEAWRGAAEVVNAVAAKVRPLGLRCAFHHHAGTFVETPAELERLLTLTDPDLVGVCLDTGHYWYGGGDPAAFARAHAGRIWHLHLKDVRGEVLERARRERTGYLDAVRGGIFCPLGEGAVPIRETLGALEAAGFDGWAVFEQDIDPQQAGARPAETARQSREFVRGLGF
jgi:inosose dehydratase